MPIQFDICGAAAPFDAPSPVDGFEFARGSIQATDGKIDLIHAGHEGALMASTWDGSLTIFDGTDGLFFGATLPNTSTALAALRDIGSGRIAGCSVLVAYDDDDVVRQGSREKVAKASLKHIAIVDEPTMPSTGVWLAGGHRDELPRRLWNLADRWQVAHLRHERKARQRRTESARSASRPVSSLVPLATVRSTPMARGRAEHPDLAQMRAAMIPRLMAAGGGVFGHAAFGRGNRR